MFYELIKMLSRNLNEAFTKAHIFVNLEIKMKTRNGKNRETLGKKNGDFKTNSSFQNQRFGPFNKP